MSGHGTPAQHLRMGDVVSYQGLHRRVTEVDRRSVEAGGETVTVIFDLLPSLPTVPGTGHYPSLSLANELTIAKDAEFLLHARCTAKGIVL